MKKKSLSDAITEQANQATFKLPDEILRIREFSDFVLDSQRHLMYRKSKKSDPITSIFRNCAKRSTTVR